MNVPKARKLKSGTWFIQLRLGGESIPVTAKTERECIKQAEFVKGQYRVGKREKKEDVPVEAKQERLTLGEAVDKYISVRTNVCSPSTIRGYNTIRRNRFKDTMPRYLDEIDEDEWKEICNREAALCAPKTLKNAWGFVSSAIDEATKNKVKGVNLPQVPKTDLPFLQPEQLDTFIEALHGTTSEIPGLLALSSLRRSEIMALRWENIDLEKKIIHVHGAAVMDQHNNLVQRKENKNDTSYRTVPILMDELYNELKKGKEENKTGLVMTCMPNTVWNRITKILKKNDFPNVGLHGLRRSFVSLAYHLGIDEDLTMEIGGWNDEKVMREHYKRLAKSDIRKQSGRLVNFFRKVDPSSITLDEAIEILRQQQERARLDCNDKDNAAKIIAAYNMAIEALTPEKQKKPEAV